MRGNSIRKSVRSILFTPGSNEKAIRKAQHLDVDGVVLDLEDAVAVNAKAEAREIVQKLLQTCEFQAPNVTIRINALDTPWGIKDLEFVKGTNATAVVVPKVEKPETVHQVVELMDQFSIPDTTEIWAMIESPLGVLQSLSIAQSHPRLKCLMMGTSDLSATIGCATPVDRPHLQSSLQTVLLAARACGLLAIDGVYLDLNDLEGFERQSEQGRDLGFDGKALIHPKTIEIANAVFSPSASEVDHASKILNVFSEVEKEGKGIAVLDGKLVENLHVDAAKRLLEKAKRN